MDVASAPDTADRAVVTPASRGILWSGFEGLMIRRQRIGGVGLFKMAVFDVLSM
jgi:hypothetical protein